jgi:hypothetical protein
METTRGQWLSCRVWRYPSSSTKGSADSSIRKKVSHAFFSSLQSLLRSLSATCLLVVYLWDGLVKT